MEASHAFDHYQREAFVDHIVDRALAKMPTPQEIEAEVQIDYPTAILFSPAEVGAELAAVEQAQAEQAEANQATYEAERAEREIQRKGEVSIEVQRQAELGRARVDLDRQQDPGRAAVLSMTSWRQGNQCPH